MLYKNFNIGRPQVAYRETITQTAECEGKYIKQSGGRGQYGHVWVKFEPNPEKGYEFVDAIVGGVVPREYIPVTDKGLQEAMAGGILAVTRSYGWWNSCRLPNGRYQSNII